MSAVLTAEQALKLVGEMFVYHMPFNRAFGMEQLRVCVADVEMEEIMKLTDTMVNLLQ